MGDVVTGRNAPGRAGELYSSYFQLNGLPGTRDPSSSSAVSSVTERSWGRHAATTDHHQRTAMISSGGGKTRVSSVTQQPAAAP